MRLFMKAVNRRVLILTWVGLGAGLILAAGCASRAAYRDADRTGKRIAAFRHDVVAIKEAVDRTGVALGDVVVQAEANPRKAYDRFAKSVEQLDAANAKANRRADEMRAEGREFFSQWQAEMAAMKDPEVRQLAEERKAEVEASFRQISRVIVEVKDSFRPWLEHVRDLRTLLGRDLTPAGIHAAQGQIVRAQGETATVQEKLDALVVELDKVTATMTPARAASR
jgi:hypothetical protein